jgi:Flp pilus assembly protein TadG
MKIRLFQKRVKREEGQSMLELAVSLIVLLILVAGIVDIGRIAFYYIALRDSAQEGASYGSIFPQECDEIEKRVTAGAVDSTRVEVTVEINGNPCSACGSLSVNAGDLIQVTVRDPNFPITMPLLGAFIGSQSINLETTIQDQVIRVPICNNP